MCGWLIAKSEKCWRNLDQPMRSMRSRLRLSCRGFSSRNTGHPLTGDTVAEHGKEGPMHYWLSGGHMVWMTISWVVGTGLLARLIWLLVNGRPVVSHSPEEILKRRYAAGEIETEEYERRLAQLRKTKGAA